MFPHTKTSSLPLKVSQSELKKPCCFYGIKANKPKEKDHCISNLYYKWSPNILPWLKITEIIFNSQQDFMDSKEQFNW